ncbi:hypothetical protein AB0L62_07920 [Nocardia asteroides]|uniref:hypothetical protein n=1 Tax=Nocardia asteroides TaxID=1824 RepID=UPI0034132534
METVSMATVGYLIRFAKDMTKSDLVELLQQAGLFDLPGVNPSLQTDRGISAPNKSDTLNKVLTPARKKAEDGNRNAHQAILKFIELWSDRFFAAGRGSVFLDRISPLLESLRSDGFELETSSDGPCRLLPTDSSAVPLSEEVTVLAAELKARGYLVALEHYDQAVEHLRNNRFESANGQLRTMFESVVVELAKDHTGFAPTKAGAGGLAIRRLTRDDAPGASDSVPGEPLEFQDGGQLLRGLWNILHKDGSHPGAADARDSRERMQMATSLANRLLRHFPASELN